MSAPSKANVGKPMSLDPEGYHDEIVVGLGKLKLGDRHPTVYPLIKISPASGKIVIEGIRRKE